MYNYSYLEIKFFELVVYLNMFSYLQLEAIQLRSYSYCFSSCVYGNQRVPTCPLTLFQEIKLTIAMN